MSEKIPDDLQEAILALLDGNLDATGICELDAELKSNRVARDRLREFATLHSALEVRGESITQTGRTLIPMERLLSAQRRTMVRNSPIAAAAILMVSVLAIWLKKAAAVPVSLADLRVGPDASFHVNHAEVVGDPPEGLVLAEGSSLHLSEGMIAVTMNTGVRAVLEAPTRFELIADDRVRLTEGSAWFDVPPSAVGFTVETSQFIAVDLGTQFGVLAPPDGKHQLHVIRGAVSLQAAGAGDEVAPLKLKQGEAREVGVSGELLEITSRPGRFATRLPRAIFVPNASFELDRNPDSYGSLSKGNRLYFDGDLTAWTALSGNTDHVQVGWRGIIPSEIHPHPVDKDRQSQALSLISGASVLNVTVTHWASLRSGDKLTLTVSLGLRSELPELDWNEGTFFGLTDGSFSPVGIPVPADTVSHSGRIADNPATGNQSGNGTFRDVVIEYTLQEADLQRPGHIGILLVGVSSQPANSMHQSFFDHVRLRLSESSDPPPEGQ